MMTYIIFFMLGVGAMVYILAPLRQQSFAWTANDNPISQMEHSLEQEKRMYIKALKDVEFELASGKVNEDDYQELKDHYRTEMSRVLGEIDGLSKKSSTDTAQKARDTVDQGEVKGEDHGTD
jgi:hypothetical protein